MTTCMTKQRYFRVSHFFFFIFASILSSLAHPFPTDHPLLFSFHLYSWLYLHYFFHWHVLTISIYSLSIFLVTFVTHKLVTYSFLTLFNHQTFTLAVSFLNLTWTPYKVLILNYSPAVHLMQPVCETGKPFLLVSSISTETGANFLNIFRRLVRESYPSDFSARGFGPD